MGRYECVRCHATCFTTDPPHLCKDVLVRLKRREKQADAAEALLIGKVLNGIDTRALAEKLVAQLARMGVTED